MSMNLIGAICFGIVIGWVTYRTLRRAQATSLGDIAVVIGAVAGAAITGIWKPGADSFGGYCIGLFVGFFAYLIIGARSGESEWIDTKPSSSGRGGGA